MAAIDIHPTDEALLAKRRLQGAGFMLLASTLVAATTLMAKALGGEGFHPLQVSAARFFFAFVVVASLVAIYRPSFKGANWKAHVGRSVFGWLGVSAMFAAAARMPLADATAISFLNPVIAVALAVPTLGERVGRTRWLAALVSLFGALVLIRPGTESFQPYALVALMAAVFMGFEVIFVKHLSDREPPLRILAINNAIGVGLSLSTAIFVWKTPEIEQWPLLVAIGVTMVSAQALFIQAMKRGDASFVMPFFYATLVFAALYDFLLFGQSVTPLSAAGAGLIVVGALLLALLERRRASRTRSF